MYDREDIGKRMGKGFIPVGFPDLEKVPAFQNQDCLCELVCESEQMIPNDEFWKHKPAIKSIGSAIR